VVVVPRDRASVSAPAVLNYVRVELFVPDAMYRDVLVRDDVPN